MRTLLGFAVAALLAGCASVGLAPDAERLFADARFKAPAEPPGNEAIFALDDEMRAFLDRRVRRLPGRYGSTAETLFAALKNELRIDYDAATTRTASETFAARSGNCLSLVILSAAFARELQVPVVYRSVYGHDTWSRSEGVMFQSGHMDIEFGSPNAFDSPLVIDFVAPDVASHLHTRAESEATVVAMYWNNRAAETLMDGDLDRAYGYARASVRSAPAFLPAYNTLGVVYLHHGDLPESERAFRYVLEREPDNVNALANLIVAVNRQGRIEEADALRARLAQIVPYPPFYFLDQGLAALKAGQYDAALELLEKERQRMPYDDEVHFAIAVAEYQKGDLPGAREHLSTALANSTTRDRRDLYAAKMAALQRLQTQN